jgi:chromosome segregation ATPase
VMLRKRVLEQELVSVSTARKRLDAQADDALCALGAAMYGQRNDQRLKPLIQQLRVVAETIEQVGAKEAAGQQANDQHRQELARLTRELAKVDFEASPLRRREAELQAKVDALKVQIKRREAQVRKVDGELEKLRASKEFSAGDQIAVLEAEREARLGELQSCNVQLVPLQEDLGALRRELAKHMGTITALREEETAVTRAMDREQERHRISTGGARSAQREALRSLATGAQRAKIAALAAPENEAAIEAAERARKKLEAEELQRAATNSYDDDGYKRGMYILVGGTALVFVVFAGLIIF